MYLFSPNRFEGRCLYLDLDSLVTGSLDELVESKGIIHLRDWGWAKNDYGTGVMAFDGGEHGDIWREYSPIVPSIYRGDQDFVTALGGWEALPAPPVLCSYRYHCKGGVPEGCAVVSFHGEKDKPHLMPENHWTRRYWQ